MAPARLLTAALLLCLQQHHANALVSEAPPVSGPGYSWTDTGAWNPDLHLVCRNCAKEYIGDGFCDCACLETECGEAAVQELQGDCSKTSTRLGVYSGGALQVRNLPLEKCARDKTEGHRPSYTDVHSYTVFVIISIAKNDRWTTFANLMGAHKHFEVRFTPSLQLEADYVKAVTAYKQTSGNPNVAIVSKFCGSHGRCVATDTDNNGDAFKPAFAANVPVSFLQYPIPHNKSVTGMDATVRQGILKAVTVMSDNIAGGKLMASAFCSQTKRELVGRHIVVLEGSAHHRPCTERIMGFKQGIEDCNGLTSGSKTHRVEWSFNADYNRSAAYAVMRTMYLVDPTINAVMACSDNMIIGAVQAAKDISDYKPEGFNMAGMVFTGYNNGSDVASFIMGNNTAKASHGKVPTIGHALQNFVFAVKEYFLGKKDTGTVKAPTVLGTVEQNSGFVDTVVSVVELTMNSTGLDINSLLPTQWRVQNDYDTDEQNSGYVYAPVVPVIAQLCSIDSPSHCSHSLQRQIAKRPKAIACVLSPFVAILSVMVGMPLILLLVKICFTHLRRGFSALARSLAAHSNLPIAYADYPTIDIVKRMRSFETMHKPFPFAVFCGTLAGLLVNLRKIPTINYDMAVGSATYGQLLGADYPSACSVGMTDGSGIGYLSGLLGFMVVARFGNVYARVLSARDAVQSSELAVYAIATKLPGLVAKTGRQDNKRVRMIFEQLAIKLKLAFELYTTYLRDGAEHGQNSHEWFAANRENRLKTYVDAYWEGESQAGQQADFASWVNSMFHKEEHDRMQQGKDWRKETTSCGRAMECVFPTNEKADPVEEHRTLLRRVFLRVISDIYSDISSLAVTEAGEEGEADDPAYLTPVEVSQVLGEVTSLLKNFFNAEGAVEVYSLTNGGEGAYPEVISSGGWFIMIYYCVMCSMIVGCKTPVEAQVEISETLGLGVGVAELCAFFLALAFYTLYQITTEIESPFGNDFNDFSLEEISDRVMGDLDIFLLQGRDGNGPLGTDSNTKARGLLSAKLMMGTETFDEEPTNKSIVKLFKQGSRVGINNLRARGRSIGSPKGNFQPLASDEPTDADNLQMDDMSSRTDRFALPTISQSEV